MSNGNIYFGNVTIYGRNAMHYAVNIWTRKYGYICFRLPLFCFNRWWPLYLYFSPNGTPWASTFMLGGKKYKRDKLLSRLRRTALGHNFKYESDPEDNNYKLLMLINSSL